MNGSTAASFSRKSLRVIICTHWGVMEYINSICLSLQNSPQFLKNLVLNTTNEELKLRRIPSKWSAHEHSCHVCVGEKYSFHKRFTIFQKETKPFFEPVSGDDFPANFYSDMNLRDSFNEFQILISGLYPLNGTLC